MIRATAAPQNCIILYLLLSLDENASARSIWPHACVPSAGALSVNEFYVDDEEVEGEEE